MKNGLMIAIFVCTVCAILAPNAAYADYLINVTTTRSSSSVPVGDVKIFANNETGSRLNTGGQLGNFGVSIGNDLPVTVNVDPISIGVSIVRGSTIEGNDLVIRTTFRPQTVVETYERKNSGGVVSTTWNESFGLNSNYNIAVQFGLAANSSAARYEFDFDPKDSFIPDFVETAPGGEIIIPWSVIQNLKIQNNLYANLRVVDLAERSYTQGFEFDITPMGGGAAVPEPSTWWAIGIIASGYAGRTGWKRWRQKRSQRDREIEGAAR